MPTKSAHTLQNMQEGHSAILKLNNILSEDKIVKLGRKLLHLIIGRIFPRSLGLREQRRIDI